MRAHVRIVGKVHLRHALPPRPRVALAVTRGTVLACQAHVQSRGRIGVMRGGNFSRVVSLTAPVRYLNKVRTEFGEKITARHRAVVALAMAGVDRASVMTVTNRLVACAQLAKTRRQVVSHAGPVSEVGAATTWRPSMSSPTGWPNPKAAGDDASSEN